jgi:DNA-binding protein
MLINGGLIMSQNNKEPNVVFIGRKPVMSYVLAVITGLNTPDNDEIILKARGRAISTAVDVAEVTRRRFVNDLKVDAITIGTEEVEQEDGRSRNVSTMEIRLKR